jgi:membrane carboxypeptidase/penicillin-binding protein
MEDSTTLSTPVRSAFRSAFRTRWKFLLSLVVLGVFGCAGVVFGVVQWLRKDLASPQALAAIQPPIKTVVYDARGRVLHEFSKRIARRCRWPRLAAPHKRDDLDRGP